MPGNHTFRFKQFTIRQDQCAMKVTSDACLYGSWLDVAHCRRILDIGTGTGLLALMAAQKSEARIDALDIDREAAKQARANVARSPWQNRIQVHRGSLADYMKQSGLQEAYDGLVCNPPFYEQGKKSRCHKKRIAWHNEQLDLEELAEAAQYFTKPSGAVYFLLPYAGKSRLEKLCLSKQLYPARYCGLKSFSDRAPHRFMAGFGKTRKRLEIEELVMYKDHQIYSDQCRALLKPFFRGL